MLVFWTLMVNSTPVMMIRIHLRRSLSILILLVSLLPGIVFAQAQQTRDFVKSRIEKTLPGYNHHNLSLTKDNRGLFFAYNPKNEKIPFGWYKIDGTNASARPKRIISSSEFSLLFRVAFSPDGSEFLTTSKTGEIAVTDLKTNEKTTLGYYTTKIGSKEFATYSFPTYTPDGKYILIHNPWKNTLLIIDAVKKDIAAATVAKGFWLEELGGESPESGDSVAIYEFSPDGNQVTFAKHQVLDLGTAKKK